MSDYDEDSRRIGALCLSLDVVEAERDAAVKRSNEEAQLAAQWQRRAERAEAELAAARALLSLARLALIYHQQQTRPIHDTVDMISAIDAALAAAPESSP